MSLSRNIKAIRELKGISVAEISAKTGLKKESIYAWEKGKYQPNEENLHKLASALGVTVKDFYEDKPLKKADEAPKLIPYYDVAAVGGMSLVAEQEPIYSPTEMIDPGTWFRAATGTMRVYGHSMFPKYPAGCIIAFKQVYDIELIQYGEDYVIETSEYRIVKRVQKSKNQDCIQVNSYNTMKDESGNLVNSPFDVPLRKIKRLFKVLGKVELETSGDIIMHKSNGNLE